jgi:hypothetical protein
MPIKLSGTDQKLVDKVKAEIRAAYQSAQMPPAVAKSIATFVMRYRNKGRLTAIRNHPFLGICESGGMPLKREDAHLDEMEPEKGYAGKVRWVCPKANNSGKKTCGAC